jgi:hypothetical protein
LSRALPRYAGGSASGSAGLGDGTAIQAWFDSTVKSAFGINEIDG